MFLVFLDAVFPVTICIVHFFRKVTKLLFIYSFIIKLRDYRNQFGRGNCYTALHWLCGLGCGRQYFVRGIYFFFKCFSIKFLTCSANCNLSFSASFCKASKNVISLSCQINANLLISCRAIWS